MVTLMEAAMYKVQAHETAHLFGPKDVLTYKRKLVKRQKDRTRRALQRAQKDHEARLTKMDREAQRRVELRRETVRNTMVFTGSIRPIPPGR